MTIDETPRGYRRFRLQVVATAIVALLVAGGAAAAAPDRDVPATAQSDAAKASKPAKSAKAAKPAKAAKAKGPKAAGERGNGNGNAHGKRVSAAARGETPPVGDCRNHGHWVSTVAKGLASCNDNPRPADNSDD